MTDNPALLLFEKTKDLDLAGSVKKEIDQVVVKVDKLLQKVLGERRGQGNRSVNT